MRGDDDPEGVAAKAGEGSTDALASFVRQYVGARHVPVLAEPIEWDNGHGYEALTIVTHQGNSYISMQPVPPGVDIANTDYWAMTGNFNAQLDAYIAVFIAMAVIIAIAWKAVS